MRNQSATTEFRAVHFIGIGGAGMSGIALVLHERGFKVTGSDLKASSYVRGLEDAGIKVPEKIRVELSAPGNNKHYEKGEVPAPSYADQIPGVEQVQADEGVQYFVAVDTDGGISFKLRAGQKLTVKDLPAGVAYQFQETIPPGWTLTFDNVAGVVVPKAEQSALYTNKYQPDVAVVTVVATKKLDGEVATGYALPITVTPGENGAASTTRNTGADGTVTFNLPVVDANGNPITYTITETLTDELSVDYYKVSELAAKQLRSMVRQRSQTAGIGD